MRRSSAREASLRAALLLLAAALALLVAEGIVRVLPETALGFAYRDGVFRPPSEFEIDLAKNADGFHDVEHGPKPEGVTRVLLLGDSFVHGPTGW